MKPYAISAQLVVAALLGCGTAHSAADSGMDASGSRDAAQPVPLTDSGPPAQTPDGGPPPDDCEPGETRATPCGNCGVVSETCNGVGVWMATSGCLAQGECAAGMVEIQAGDRCLEETRICDEGCAWRPWETTVESGECNAGETRDITEDCGRGEHRTQTCSAACLWEDTTVCIDSCSGTRRTSPWDAEELCVAAGPFIRGMAGWTGARPEAEVYVSAFYIDRYPVSNARYATCVDAGVCAVPRGPDFADPTRLNHPVHGVTWFEAREFCTWDDGRRLPTEAEWEKAARGPAPTDQSYPWGTSRCGVLPFRRCGWDPPTSDWEHTFNDISAFPAAASYYGAELMLGGVRQWVSDWYDQHYYAEPASRTDPQGPATGTARVQRGAERTYSDPELWRRFGNEPDVGPPLSGFRCARTGR